MDEALAHAGLHKYGGQDHLEAGTGSRSVRIGDVGLIVYKGTYGRDTFWLCSVVSVSPDVHGTVRNCELKFRPRHIIKKSKENKPRTNLCMEMGVQGFTILLPVEH